MADLGPVSVPPPRPGPAAALLGAVRVVAVLAVLVVGTVAVLGAALLPGYARGARPAQWVAVGLARLFLATVGVRLRVEGGAALRAHRGFVFFNHPTFIDPVLVMAVRPVRFLAAAGVRRLPLLGWMASAVGTLFVNRGQDESRAQSRDALLEAARSSPVPIALAPEGGIYNGEGVGPLRHGAFDVAAGAGADVRLVALSVEPRAYTRWHDGEWLLAPLWRLCARTAPLVATVRVLPALDADGQAADVAAEAERRLAAALGVRPAPTDGGGAVAA